MALHHIIPKFILRGFTLNPEAEKDEQEIMIYDKKLNKIYNEKINTAYAKENFNSEQTETLLCKEYENKVALLFKRIEKRALTNEKFVEFSNEEYKLLFRFFTIMWRRNDIQMQNAKKLFFNVINEFENILENLSGKKATEMLKDEYKNMSHEDMFELKKDDLRIPLYDKIILSTNDNSESVLKNIKNYIPVVVHNQSKINFLLHNTYGTMNYILKKGCYEANEFDYPINILEPISNKLSFYLMPSKDEINLNMNEYKISIEHWDNDEQIKQFFIDGYITPQATSFVVDDTNKNLIIN